MLISKENMKRLVDYEDDPEDVPLRPPPLRAPMAMPNTNGSTEVNSIASATKGLIQTKQQNAKEIFIEGQAFDQALYRVERQQVKKPLASQSNKRDSRESGVGDPLLDGPWAPVEEEPEQEVFKPEMRPAQISLASQPGKHAPESLSLEDMEPSSTEIHLQETVERHGSNRADYQRRRFTDERRWPTRISFYPDDDNDEGLEEESVDDTVVKMIGRRQPSKKHRTQESHVPIDAKEPMREYIGHNKGISKVRLYGCLALTAGMDGSVKIWDCALPDDMTNATKAGLADETGAIQTYWGHDGRAVKDCDFPVHSPASFVSCGYNGFGLVWDTETGNIVNRYKADTKGISVNAARFKTDDDNQLILAFGDRKLRHWDIREPSDKPAQIYDFHQSSVSSVLFCEHGNKFVSTGEDRKLLVWDWRVPSPVKIISELWIPGMPTTAAHPSTMSFVAVGLDNRLFQFQVHKRTGVVNKSGECLPNDFRVAGFACEPAYSPCGKYLACGDDSGNIHFLRTKTAFTTATGYNTQRITGAHQAGMPVSSVAFHPCLEGVLMSVSWDGKMKMWR